MNNVSGLDWNGNAVSYDAEGGRVTIFDMEWSKISFDLRMTGNAWYAFWLLGTDNTYKEIDIFETFSDIKSGNVKMSAAYHYGKSSTVDRDVKRSNYFINNKKVNLFLIEKNVNTIRTFVNGYLVNEQPNVFDKTPQVLFECKQSTKKYGTSGLISFSNIKYQ